MKNIKPSILLRAFVGVGVPAAAILLLFIIFSIQSTPPCIFYELTGLYCVGCGAGRAALSLLRLDLYAAFRYNPLLIILSPFFAYYTAKVYIRFVFGRDLLPFPKIRAKQIGVAVLAIIIAYWIFRNIPVPPFSYLAPTAL